MSETMNDKQVWQPCKYENKCVSPPIFGECYLLKIGDAARWIHAGVYPVHGGWDLHVQEVVMRGRTEVAALLPSHKIMFGDGDEPLPDYEKLRAEWRV